MELKIFAVALIVQGRAGGNLAELLTKLAVMIRQRIRFKQRVRSLTSEGRMQALVLIVLPPVVFAALCVLNPKYAYVLFDHPHLLYGAVASQLIGAACIQRIIRIDY
jgi:tight adherence protein B